MNSLLLRLLLAALAITANGCAHHPHYYSNYPSGTYPGNYYGENVKIYRSSYSAPSVGYQYNGDPHWHEKHSPDHHEHDKRNQPRVNNRDNQNRYHLKNQGYQRHFRDN